MLPSVVFSVNVIEPNLTKNIASTIYSVICADWIACFILSRETILAYIVFNDIGLYILRRHSHKESRHAHIGSKQASDTLLSRDSIDCTREFAAELTGVTVAQPKAPVFAAFYVRFLPLPGFSLTKIHCTSAPRYYVYVHCTTRTHVLLQVTQKTKINTKYNKNKLINTAHA